MSYPVCRLVLFLQMFVRQHADNVKVPIPGIFPPLFVVVFFISSRKYIFCDYMAHFLKWEFLLTLLHQKSQNSMVLTHCTQKGQNTNSHGLKDTFFCLYEKGGLHNHLQ